MSNLMCETEYIKVYSKRKEFAPIGSEFFSFRADPFSEGTQNQPSQVARLSFHPPPPPRHAPHLPPPPLHTHENVSNYLKKAKFWYSYHYF